MIPSPDLEGKQLEMQARSQKRRSKQNSKNAKGSRRKENLPILRGTRREVQDLIRDYIASFAEKISARDLGYLIYAYDCYKRDSPVLTRKKFESYLPEDKESDDSGTDPFILHEPVSRSEQDPAVERETLSSAG
jgi:hypothetical protein